MTRMSVPKNSEKHSDKSERNFEDWFLAHNESRRQGRFSVRPPEVSGYINFLWPATLEYYSPLNPILLNECIHLDLLNQHPVWLARDGLVPLLWFFKSNPNPGKFKGKLLIFEDFAHFVPNSWRDCVGTYSIESTHTGSVAKPDKLILTSLVMDTYCSLKHLQKQLQSIVDVYGKNELAHMEIIAFLPGKFEGYGNEHKHEFHSEFMIKICNALGSHIKALNWRQLEALESFEGYQVVEFNERLLFVDSFMTHYPMSKGAKVFERKEKTGSKEGHFVHLSPFHGMRIKKHISSKTAADEKVLTISGNPYYSPTFEEVMMSEANKRYPWPAWFTEWSRSAAKTKEK